MPKLVKNYSSTDAGANAQSGAASGILSVIDSTLRTGYNVLTATSVVVASGIATIQFPSSGTQPLNAVVLIDGATAINGEARVLSSEPGRITVATTAPDGPVSGTITVRVAGAGWDRPFAPSADEAAYRSVAVGASGAHLRVTDSAGVAARMRGFMSMTSLASGADAFPTDAQRSGGAYWPKSTARDATPRRWRVFADERAFYYFGTPTHTGAAGAQGMFFGDLVPEDPTDAYAVALTDLGGAETAFNSMFSGCVGTARGASSSTDPIFLPKADSGFGGSVAGTKRSSFCTATLAYSGWSAYAGGAFPFPNGAGSSLHIYPVYIFDSGGVRGRLPGLYHCPQQLVGALTDGTVIPGTGAYAGRQFMVVSVGEYDGNAQGAVLIDMTGPWR